MKEKMDKVQAQTLILKNSITEVDINQSTCPFCGSPQEVVGNEIIRKHHMYDYCRCGEMTEYLQKQKELSLMEDQLIKMTAEFEKSRLEALKQLASSGIGKRFINATFDNYDKGCNMKAYEIAHEYAENFDCSDGKGLIFTGGVGTGKTHLAAAIANRVADKFAARIEFETFSEAIAEIKSAFSDSKNDKHLEKRMCEADLLVLDDLGKETRSPFNDELLYRVVNYRYKDKLPIVITSNLRMEFLVRTFDYAVMSRLMEICKAVNMQGNDYRVRDYLS